MNESTKTFKYSQKNRFGSAIFLGFVILLTIGLALYNSYIEKNNMQLTQQISEHKNTIKNLEGQEKVYIYSLIKLHQKALDELDERSRITKYMDHFSTMASYYNFEARGFQMGGGKILSKVSFENNDFGIAYKKAARFMADYRSDESALLDLDFIGNIKGGDTDIKFPISLTLK